MPSVVFVGAHVEGVEPLEWLLDHTSVRAVVTLRRERLAAMSGGVDLEPYAAGHGVPVRRVDDLNDPEHAAWLEGVAPDLLVVIGWTRLLGSDLLRAPRVAALGFHASLLPAYRGRAPINWALINDEPETGNTLMILDPEADAGDIVAQRRIVITDMDDCASLYRKVSASEVSMLADAVETLEKAGRLVGVPQDDAEATVMPRRRPEDGLISWSDSSRRLFNWVRAQTHPYPGAFTYLDGKTLHIWSAEVADGSRTGSGPPGTVAAAGDGDGGVIVATGDGWLRLRRVQLAGGPETDGSEIPAGRVLGGDESQQSRATEVRGIR